MTSEFRKLLDGAFSADDRSSWHSYSGSHIGHKFYLTFEEQKTIRRALLIADRLMQEPSEGMVEAGAIAAFSAMLVPIKEQQLSGMASLLNITSAHEWKAMRDQLLKEVDNGPTV